MGFSWGGLEEAAWFLSSKMRRWLRWLEGHQDQSFFHDVESPINISLIREHDVAGCVCEGFDPYLNFLRSSRMLRVF